MAKPDRCLCGHHKFAHSFGQGECHMTLCVCRQYRPLHPDIETVFGEKNKAISDLIKEHVAMRKQIELAREQLFRVFGLPSEFLEIKETTRQTLAEMDRLQKGINNAD